MPSSNAVGQIAEYLERLDIIEGLPFYFKAYETAEAALIREKQLKCYHRQKKIKIIQQMNPSCRDLHESLGG